MYAAMESTTFFSIIIPVHNKLPHLDRSINSVLQQTYKNFELILVDDASTDGSEIEILKYSDPRIRLFRRTTPGPGGYAARNLGIQQARYGWVCFLDADDEWNINLLQTVRQTIANYRDVECVSWGWRNVRNDKQWIDKTSLQNRSYGFRYFSLTDFFNQRHTLWTGAVAFKRDLILQAGSFPEVGYKRGGDVDTWIRCLWHSRASIWINRNLSTYHLDSVNMVTRQVKMDPTYIFTPFVVQLKSSSDKALSNAIRNYQNERIFSTVRAQIIAGGPVDYSVLRKMNVTIGYFALVARLLYNKLRYGMKPTMSRPLKKAQLTRASETELISVVY